MPSLHCNSLAIALFRSPRATSSAISRSRAVRLASGSAAKSIFLLCPKIMLPILSQAETPNPFFNETRGAMPGAKMMLQMGDLS